MSSRKMVIGVLLACMSISLCLACLQTPWGETCQMRTCALPHPASVPNTVVVSQKFTAYYEKNVETYSSRDHTASATFTIDDMGSTFNVSVQYSYDGSGYSYGSSVEVDDLARTILWYYNMTPGQNVSIPYSFASHIVRFNMNYSYAYTTCYQSSGGICFQDTGATASGSAQINLLGTVPLDITVTLETTSVSTGNSYLFKCVDPNVNKYNVSFCDQVFVDFMDGAQANNSTFTDPKPWGVWDFANHNMLNQTYDTQFANASQVFTLGFYVSNGYGRTSYCLVVVNRFPLVWSEDLIAAGVIAAVVVVALVVKKRRRNKMLAKIASGAVN